MYEGLSFAARRGQELSHEFTRLEIQIAATLFAFSGLFLGFLAGVPNLWMRSLYAVALFLLISSMTLGLFHIKRKEKSWDDAVKERELKFNNWQETIGRNGTVEEARAFEIGVSRGIAEVTSPPLWSWLLQSAFLGAAVILLFVVALIFLFTS